MRTRNLVWIETIRVSVSVFALRVGDIFFRSLRY